MMINKVLVSNRGEIAVRIIRTCKELGLQTVAVFSEADRESPYVRYADEAYFIGPSPAQESYLQGERIIRIALQAKAQAIHPGYGFLAESWEFARACRNAGLVFIGPKPETIKILGDKMAARRLARRLHIPVTPGINWALDDVNLIEAAQQVDFPVMVKAVSGGGGIGIRTARSRSELEQAIPSARHEAQAAFGDGDLFVEKLIENARHIEVQILGDTHGNIIHLGERECSIQRRHQKLVEEAPSRAIDLPVRNKIFEAAVRLASSIGYISSGTVEFLIDQQGKFYFLEVNPRLQVEHPVTEAVTGVDIVKEQLRIAAGRRLSYTQEEVQTRGWAIESRILAEDPNRDFLACTGSVLRLTEPGGLGIRVDSGISEGSVITPYYDSLLSKLVTWGETRAVAIVRMRRALEEYRIHGLTTNIELLRALFNSHRFFGGQFHTQFLEERFAPQAQGKENYLAAAITAVWLDWQKRNGAQRIGNKFTNVWKIYGRWEALGDERL